MREYRQVPISEVRFTDDETNDAGRRFSAVVLRYRVIDDYNTIFEPGVFAESMRTRMPRICWSHDWADPIGRWIDFEDTEHELILHGELDDFDAVPRARQASAQLRSGTIDQFSVGFVRTEDRLAEDTYGPGVTAIEKGLLDEASLVLVGAVPGTRPLGLPTARSGGLALSVRMPGQSEPGGDVTSLFVPVEVAQSIVLRMQNGELDLADGLTELKRAAAPEPAGDADTPADPPPADPPPTDPPADPDPDPAAGTQSDDTDPGGDANPDTGLTDEQLEAEAEEALALIGEAP